MARSDRDIRGLADAALALLLCGVFACLALRQAATTSATYDETAHLPAGYTYLRWHDYRLNPEHPPLAKMLAALPLLAGPVWPSEVDVLVDRHALTAPPGALGDLSRAWAAALRNGLAQWTFGHAFLYGIRDEVLVRLNVTEGEGAPTTVRLTPVDFWNDADSLLFRGRTAVLVLALCMGLLVFVWARQLYGRPAAVLALTLFALDPSLLANSALVTTDVPVSLFFFATVFFLWRACQRLRLLDAGLSVLCFALAFVTKFSAVLLVPVTTVLLVGRVLAPTPWPLGAGGPRALGSALGRAGVALALLAACGLATYGTVWAAYGFRYSAARDPGRAAEVEARLFSEPVAGRTPGQLPFEALAPGRVLQFAQRHRVLPEAYLYGLAFVRQRSQARASYLRGDYSPVGFRSYFLWTFLLKTPIVTLVALGLALGLIVRRPEPWATRLAFLAVPVLVYGVVTLGAALNIGHRHLLPIYPFLFVLCGRLGLGWTRLPPARRPTVAAGTLAAIVASAFFVFAPPWRPATVYPHYLAYFNELAGGPRNGYRSLVDSSLDWGQDLRNLGAWLDERGIREPINLAYFGTADPLQAGIAHLNLPGGYPLEPRLSFVEGPDGRVEVRGARIPGYVAISATNLIGAYMKPEDRARWRAFLGKATLMDRIGYSIFVYYVNGVDGVGSRPP